MAERVSSVAVVRDAVDFARSMGGEVPVNDRLVRVLACAVVELAQEVERLLAAAGVSAAEAGSGDA